jgi:hypothetical protein
MNRLYPSDSESIGRLHDELERLRSSMPLIFRSVQALTRGQLAVLVESAFWATLEFNEGRTSRFCLTVVGPEGFRGATAFRTPIPFDATQIARLSHAVPEGGCLLVTGENEGLRIWGVGRSRPVSSLHPIVVEASEPGIVRFTLGPFQPFAVFNGRSDPIVESSRFNLAHYLERVLQKRTRKDEVLEEQASVRECLVLASLARTMFTDGQGGIILIVPGETGPWAASLNPFAYQLAAPDTTIPDGIRRTLNEAQARGSIIEQVSRADVPERLKGLIAGAIADPHWYPERDVRAIAGLAGVDGAIVMTRDLKVLGFGAKLVGDAAVEEVSVLHPGRGNQPQLVALKDLGGTKHQSAAQFVAAHKDTVAIVISHDRHMKIMHWDESAGRVMVLWNVEWWV